MCPQPILTMWLLTGDWRYYRVLVEPATSLQMDAWLKFRGQTVDDLPAWKQQTR